MKDVFICVKDEQGNFIPIVEYMKQLEEKIKWLQGKKCS